LLAEESAVVISIERRGRVAIDRCWIRDTAARGIAEARRNIGATTEQERHDTCLQVTVQVGATRVLEQPLDLVVLVMLPGIVLGAHARVAHGNLPERYAFLRHADEAGDELLIATEVAGRPPRVVVAVLQPLEVGVAIAELGERDVE